MALTITHAKVTSGAVDDSVEVDLQDWNDSHAIAGSIAASEVTSGAALTKTDDTNVTLTLGGSPTAALLAATSVTVGWTGTLAASRGGTGISSLGTGVATALGVNVGSAGAFVVNGGALGTPSSGTLTNATGLPLSTGITGAGTGVLAALAVNVGSAGAFVTFNGALGTPASGTLTNCTGLPATGLSGLGGNVAAWMQTPSSANLAAAVPDETGSGALVFATSPTLVTPALGTPSSGVLTNCSGLPGVLPHCGRLRYSSTTALTFLPLNGNAIKINGAIVTIPTTGVTGLANTSVFVNGTGGQNLGASTLYYVYGFVNSGTLTADFSTTAYATSTTSGNEGTVIKSGDDTRTLLGMIRTNGSSQFADSTTQRFVISWFNRRGLATVNVLTANRTTTSATFAELNTEIRNEFLSWADESTSAQLAGGMNLDTAAQTAYVGIAFDGTTVEEGTVLANGTSAPGLIGPAAASVNKTLSEGYHYATCVGTVSGGATLTVTGSATSGKRTALTVRISG